MNNEFKVKKSKEQTVYTLESASVGGTSTAGGATVTKALGGVHRRAGDNLLAQEAGNKKEPPKPRNFVAKNAKMGGAGQHQDKKKAMKQGKEKHRKPYMENFDSPEYNDEAGMAKSNLLTIARAVTGLLKTIDDNDNLPEWGQEKIAKAEMMLVSVWDYLQSQKQMGNDPQVEAYGRYDRRDAYQRDYDSSVSGMDRPYDHRGLGQELAHEKNNYAVAIDGRTWKVFADKRQAQNIARSLQAKGKNATVHETGAEPTESVAEGERTMSRAAKGHEKYGKAGMAALAKAGREGASDEKLDAIRDKHDKYNEGAEFGSNYAEQLAQQVFNHNPNIEDENQVLNLGYNISKSDLGSRAQGIFRDEDFPSDFVSAYFYLQKNQGQTESAPKGWEGTVKAMKKHDEIDNPWALAHWMKNKGYKSHKEDAYMESLFSKLAERAKK